MDTSSPAVFVNAELLKMYLGRRVRAVVQVLRIEGGVILGQSTDGQQLTVKGSQSFPVSHYVEVIGIADGNQSIRAEICTDFGEKFEAVAWRMQVLVAESFFPPPFIGGKVAYILIFPLLGISGTIKGLQEAAAYNTLCQLANGKHKSLFL